MAQKKRLGNSPLMKQGKGLGALIDGAVPIGGSSSIFDVEDNKDSVINVKISLVEPNPDQPRKRFDKEKLEELSSSIEKHGIMQPITVVEKGGKYLIVAGERRWRAARLAKLAEVPVLVKDLDDKQIMELGLIENLQREDLNVIEEAEGYQRLINEFGMTQEQVAETVGKSRPAVTNAIRLLKLEPYVRGLVADGALSSGHAKAILSLKNSEKQEDVANYVLERELSVRETENYVSFVNNPPVTASKKKSSSEKKSPEVKAIEKKLQERLKTKVSITEKTGSKGILKIEYFSIEEFERITKNILK